LRSFTARPGETSESPAPVASTEPTAAPTPPIPKKPASAYKWICGIGKSGGTENFLAIDDDGTKFEIGSATTAAGPFHVIEENSGTKLVHTILDPQAMKGDLVNTFQAAGVNPSSVKKLTVYGFTMHGGWSFGVGVFTDSKGAYLGKFSWAMSLGFSRPCRVE
jgi:hypothetical protein